MRKVLASVARLGLDTILTVFAGIAHGEDDAFLKWAAAHAVPLTTLEPSGDFSDLLPLKSAIGSARVVALGEPTHGAHEPLAFRNRLFRFLVEEMGFTAIALESGFSESTSVEAFVRGGPGDAHGVLADKLVGEPHPYVENVELIQWMRDYNATAPNGHHRLHFYGIDLTFGGGIGAPRRTIHYALAYLSRANAADAERIQASLGDSLPPANDRTFGMLSQPALAELDSAIQKIADSLTRNRRSLIAHTSVEEYRWALHNLEAARQLSKCFHLTTPLSFTDRQYSGPVLGCRDQAMADNVQWAVENEGPKGRVLVFAHNGHVNNAQDWTPEKPFWMGGHLRRTYGKRLLIIATSSATASGGLETHEPLEADTIDATLAHIGPKFFLDLRTARQDPAALAWLSTERRLHQNIINHMRITPSTAVDAFVFLGGLTPAGEQNRDDSPLE